MKFKVGDKVSVVNLTSQSNPDKAIFIGKEFTVDYLTGLDRWPYTLSDAAKNYNWCDAELERVGFTKSDLKDGMVIEYRDGDRRIVLNNKFVWRRGYLDFEDFNDDFVSKGGSYEIVKVYISSATSLDDWCKDHYLKLIWERKEEPTHKEMTIEEIEKELGYKIKVVGDSSCQK